MRIAMESMASGGRLFYECDLWRDCMNEMSLTEAEINKYEHESAVLISDLIEKRNKLTNKGEALKVELYEIDKSILDVQKTVEIFNRRLRAIS
jgi:hypothetical protein